MKSGLPSIPLPVLIVLASALSSFHCADQGLNQGEAQVAELAVQPPGVHFQLVTEGPLVEGRASTGGVSWVDFDGDGDDDLFAANGYDVSAATPAPQKNRLYRNDGSGTFSPVDCGPPVDDDGYSSGSTWGDMDNDGDPDFFVPNQQDQQNFLYRNDGGTFTRLTDSAPAMDGGHSYSAAWVDVDQDGLLDLFVANGGLSHSGPDFLYRNDGEGRFSRITEGAAVTTDGASGSAVWGDCDNDGDLDFHIGSWPNEPGPGEQNQLYRNETSAAHWLKIRLQGGVSNRSAIGARITVEATISGHSTSQIREVSAQNSFRSQNSLVQHVGLGDADTAVRVTVHWPSGRVSTVEDVPANELLEISEEISELP